MLAATAPFSDDPCRLLSWANVALIERASETIDFVTAACVTYLPRTRRLRWAYAGHPPALSLDNPRELAAPKQRTPLGIGPSPGCVEGSHRSVPSAGMLLYTDGLTEARRGNTFFGLGRRDDCARRPSAPLADRGGRRPTCARHRVRDEHPDRRSLPTRRPLQLTAGSTCSSGTTAQARRRAGSGTTTRRRRTRCSSPSAGEAGSRRGAAAPRLLLSGASQTAGAQAALGALVALGVSPRCCLEWRWSRGRPRASPPSRLSPT